MTIEVQCVTRSKSENAHECIQYLGGVDYNGKRWQKTVPEAILEMRQRGVHFYVTEGEHEVPLVITTDKSGHRYLRTQADGDKPDHLLSLPECPPL
jgi:Protein of unknown function (DUF3892)